jgi:hypothetical protein
MYLQSTIIAAGRVAFAKWGASPRTEPRKDRLST